MARWVAQKTRRLRWAALCAACGLLWSQVPLRPVLAQTSDPAVSAANSGLARVTITSDPTGQKVTLDGAPAGAATPVTLDLAPGEYHLMVNADGFQPLSHDLVAATGQHVSLKFILLATPPEPPSPQALRELALPVQAAGNGGTNKSVGTEGNSCLQCHPSIPQIHAQGIHRTVSCAACHGNYDDHVAEGQVIAPMPVIRGEGVQVLCLTCHSQDNRSAATASIAKVKLPEHLAKRGARPDHTCVQCHHVHSPLKWVHESREMVGLPEILTIEPLADEREAGRVRQKFNSMTETFTVFPLVPGAIGKLAFSDDTKYPFDELLISGVVLVGTSYILGKIYYKRSVTEIRAINDQRRLANQRVKSYNKMVAQAMADHNEAVVRWGAAAEGRGVVIVR